MSMNCLKCNDRNQRSTNIIIHNLAKSNIATNVAVAKAHDAKPVNDFLCY